MIYKIYDNIDIEIDDEDYLRVSTALTGTCEWHLNRKTKQIVGWTKIDGKRVKIILSRFLLNCLLTDLDLNVDHIDKNRLNNKKSNLRLVTHQENCFGARFATPGRGTVLDKRSNRWTARIRTKEGRLTLGWWDTQAEAQTAYDAAVIKYHGEFAAR